MTFPTLNAEQIKRLVSETFPFTNSANGKSSIGGVVNQLRNVQKGDVIFMQYYGDAGESEAVETLALLELDRLDQARNKVIWAVARFCRKNTGQLVNGSENAAAMKIILDKFAV